VDETTPFGTISDSKTVEHGDDVIYTITPNDDYQIKAVKVDGVEIQNPQNTYMFDNVTSNHEIVVSFERDPATYEFVIDKINESIPGDGSVLLTDISGKNLCGLWACNLLLAPVEGKDGIYQLIDRVCPWGNENWGFTKELGSGMLIAAFHKNDNTPSDASAAIRRHEAEEIPLGTGLKLWGVDLDTPSLIEGLTPMLYVPGGGDDPSAATLSAPTLSLNGSVVSWNAVANAESYTLTLYKQDTPDTVEKTVENIQETTYDLSLIAGLTHGAKYVVKVQAIGDGTRFNSSELSAASDPYTVPYLLTVTSTPSNGGTVLVQQGEQSVSSLLPNSSYTYTVTPNSGYQIKSITVNGLAVDPIDDKTANYVGNVTNISADQTIAVEFEKIPITVTVTCSSGGTVAWEDNQISETYTVYWGDSMTLTVTPDTEYSLLSVTVDDTPVTVENNQFVLTVRGNHTVRAEFGRVQNTIELTIDAINQMPGGNGACLITTSEYKQYQNTSSYSMLLKPVQEKPNTYVFVESIHKMDLETDPDGTFQTPWEDGMLVLIHHEDWRDRVGEAKQVSLNTELKLWGVDLENEKLITDLYESPKLYVPGGEDDPEVRALAVPQNLSFRDGIAEWDAVSGAASYTVELYESGSVNPLTIENIQSNTYTFTQELEFGRTYYFTVQAVSGTEYCVDSAMSAQSTQYTKPLPQYEITASAGTGGIIDPAGVQTVDYGSSITFTFAPNDGYEIAYIKVDNNEVAITNSYTFESIDRSHTIEVAFALIETTPDTPVVPDEPTVPQTEIALTIDKINAAITGNDSILITDLENAANYTG
ncbi:MAG: hypothetical protein IJ334_14970, partial [Clostridia bacterium]|nr:hypothetical protein [Clostridia bacterium]